MSCILLVGGSGQLGVALAAAFATADEIVTTGQTAAAGATRSLDLGDPRAVAAILEGIPARRNLPSESVDTSLSIRSKDARCGC